MQRYAYFLDSNLAINTKKRILRFDNLSQELKLSIDRGLFTPFKTSVYFKLYY